MGKDLLDRFTIDFKHSLDDGGLRRIFSKLAKEKQLRIGWNIGIN